MSLELFWFWAVFAGFAAFVVLDGFDLGVGMLMLFVAKTPQERQQVRKTIGPVWDANEVCLLAAGGALFMAFPALYAYGLQSFYLPVTLLLWLLVLRALGIELPHHLHDRPFAELFDGLFFVGSLGVALCLGLALGNVVRGVDFRDGLPSFVPLFTDFWPHAPVGAIDVYTLAVALSALSALALHGALWLVWRTDGPVQARCNRLLTPLLGLTAALSVLCAALSIGMLPRAAHTSLVGPGSAITTAAAAACLVAVAWQVRQARFDRAFLSSSLFLVAMLATAATSLLPDVLPNAAGPGGLAIQTAKSNDTALRSGLYWLLPGTLLAVIYFVHNYRSLPRKVALAATEDHTP